MNRDHGVARRSILQYRLIHGAWIRRMIVKLRLQIQEAKKEKRAVRDICFRFKCFEIRKQESRPIFTLANRNNEKRKSNLPSTIFDSGLFKCFQVE